MKRLILYVLMSLLTFSTGVGLGKLLADVKTTEPLTPLITFQPISPRLFEAPTTATITTPQPVNASAPVPNFIFDYDREKFDPYGYYTVMGHPPKGFREFKGIDLTVYELEGEGAGEITLIVYSNEMYQGRRAVIGLVTERRLYFATESVSDDEIEYRFDGEFLRGKIVADAPAGTAVLKGTLTKSKNGRKIGEAVVKFDIEVHGC